MGLWITSGVTEKPFGYVRTAFTLAVKLDISSPFQHGLIIQNNREFGMHSCGLRLHFRRLADLTLAGELLDRFAPALASGRIPAADLHNSSEPQFATKGGDNQLPNDVSERIGRTQEVRLPAT